MAKKLINYITIEEYTQLIKALQKEKKKKNKKQYLLCMMLAFEAGLRISEIVGHKGISRRKNKKTGEIIIKEIIIPSLTKDKIDFNKNTIKVESGKGGKDRIVPLPRRITKEIVSLLPIPLTRRAIQKKVSSLGKRVLDRKINFHMLRHGFGSHLAASDRPLHEIQMLMGHSRLDTTGIYLHANPKKAIEGAREVFKW